MRFEFVLIMLMPAFLAADTLWTYPFDELGASWDIGSGWISTDDGFYTGALKNLNEPNWIYFIASSGWMTIPSGYDSVTVDMVSAYDYYGYAMDGGSQISMKGFIYTIENTAYQLVNIEDGVVTWNYQSYGATDTCFVSQTVPVGSGDQMSLNFTAGMNSWGYIKYVELYWSISNLTITGHGNVSLESTTWGSIKTPF